MPKLRSWGGGQDLGLSTPAAGCELVPQGPATLWLMAGWRTCLHHSPRPAEGQASQLTGAAGKPAAYRDPELQACSLYLLHAEFQSSWWCWKCLFLGPAPHPGARLANADIRVDRACFVPGPSLCPRDLSRLPQIPWASPLATGAADSPWAGNATQPYRGATTGKSMGSSHSWELSAFPSSSLGSLLGRLIFNSFTYFWRMYMHIPQNYKRT